MYREHFKRVLRRETRGFVSLLGVLAIAAAALLLPRVTQAQQLTLTSFSSPPPPTTPTVSVLIPSTAHLSAKIRVVSVVAVRCGPFAHGTSGPPTTTVNVSQARFAKVVEATGYLSPTVTCDNAVHLYRAEAIVGAGNPPFTTGKAVMQVSVSQCGYDQNYSWVCPSANRTRTITLTSAPGTAQ